MKNKIIQNTFVRITIAILLSLIWDQYIKSFDFQSIYDYPLFFFGALYLMFAWFNYLKLDGFRIKRNFEKQDKTITVKHKSKQMIDYVDTEISEVELSHTELLKCKLYSNCISGVLLILPSLFMFIF